MNIFFQRTPSLHIKRNNNKKKEIQKAHMHGTKQSKNPMTKQTLQQPRTKESPYAPRPGTRQPKWL
jgi:hypothetical protein